MAASYSDTTGRPLRSSIPLARYSRIFRAANSVFWGKERDEPHACLPRTGIRQQFDVRRARGVDFPSDS